jgi:D-glycero-D-manno-heptose 1,7-bisphosphate phosphatase
MTTVQVDRAAVFFDRDGVLNESVIVHGRPYPPTSAAELTVEDSTVEACAQLRAASLALVVVSNQPDIARRTQSRAAVDAINVALQERLPLDAILICPHDDADECACRKPKPGMLLRAARELRLDLSRSVMVGDRWRDVEAGRRAGCATVFLDRGYEEPRPERADLVVGQLQLAVPWILSRLTSRQGGRNGAATD